MLDSFVCIDSRVHIVPRPIDPGVLRIATWIDLEQPDPEEIDLVHQATGLHIPTEAEVSEIETSSRLANRDGVLYLSMPLVSTRQELATAVPVGFVLSQQQLITVRFASSRVFRLYQENLVQDGIRNGSAAHVLVGLLEAIVDRQADLLEQVRHDCETISHTIFAMGRQTIGGRKKEDASLRRIIGDLGRLGDLGSHVQETLVGIARIAPYVESCAGEWLPRDLPARLTTIRQDVASIGDLGTHLSDKQQFLLDATLGFVNIAQNNVMKVMAIASVVGIPPVLIAGIYGMNFKNIPELDLSWGYAYAWGAIILSMLIPTAMFRWWKWI